MSFIGETQLACNFGPCYHTQVMSCLILKQCRGAALTRLTGWRLNPNLTWCFWSIASDYGTTSMCRDNLPASCTKVLVQKV